MKKTFVKMAWMFALALPAFIFSACNDDDDPVSSDKAEILSVKFNDQPVVKSQPVLDAETTPQQYVFYVRHDVADDDIKALVPTIEISENATISPASDVAADFTSGSVRYTVTAEDGTTKIPYDLVCKKLPSDEALVTSVVFRETDIVTEQPSFEAGATSATFKVKAGTTDAEKSSLTPDIQFIGKSIDPESGEPQDFTEGSVTYTVTADDDSEFKFTLNCEVELFTGAQIEEIAFKSDIISLDPVTQGNKIYFAVKEEATDDEIKALVLSTFKLSDGASANFEEGQSLGLEVGKAVEVVVEAENGEKNTYEITCYRSIYYDFEEWNEDSGYDMVKPWFNANGGVSFAIGFNMVANKTYPFKKTADSYSKNFAAELKTNVMAPNAAGLAFGVPNLVAGNLFLGGFKTEASAPITSTKFGIPFYHRPEKVTGMFKYIPGDPDNFWNNTDLEKGNKDSYAMTALLYEVADYGRFEDGVYTGVTSWGVTSYNFGDVLTGEDMKDITSNGKVVALAQNFDTETVADFSRFELNLEYLQPYSADKKYKFSIIFSSSKEGADYRGAEGSTLIIDDVHILF